MGFWKCLKFWDTRSIVDTTIETTQKNYRRAKARYPDGDCHAWLAITYDGRLGYKVAPLVAFTRTTLYSLLGDDAPTALAYFLLSEEMPHAVSQFNESQAQILKPVLELIHQGRFLERWERENPWTFANLPVLREVVEESVKCLSQQMPS